MEFLGHAAEALTGLNLLVAVLGLIIGIALGALPGLSSTFSCAVMLPMTFTMEPATALIFLGTIYMGSTYGGSFAAILVNTPGTPQSITTTFDGFPLARRGEGGFALSIACVASVIGGLVGIASFLWLAPPLAEIALLFGPAEYFWLALFGLTIIASLSEGNLIKGLMSGLFGLLLSQIGVSVVRRRPLRLRKRRAAGRHSDHPATIGLLCLPVVIDMVATPRHQLDAPLGRQPHPYGPGARRHLAAQVQPRPQQRHRHGDWHYPGRRRRHRQPRRLCRGPAARPAPRTNTGKAIPAASSPRKAPTTRPWAAG